MKAAILVGSKDIRIKDIKKPEINDDEFILKVKAVGICGSDLRTYVHGHPRVHGDFILGHEFAGIVDQCGKNIEGIKPGDRVAIHPGIPCNNCSYCHEGHQNMCINRKVIGTDLSGAFAEYMVIPKKTLEVGTVVRIPETMDFGVATLAEPLVAALNGQQLLQTKLGDSVVILGAGPLGFFHAKMARLRGATQIILVNLSRGRLDFAQENNLADEYFCLEEDGDLQQFVLEKTDHKGANKVVVANTSSQSAKDAIYLAAKNGTVQFFAGFNKANPMIEVDGNVIHYKQVSIIGSYGSQPRQYRLAVELLFSNTIDAHSLITHRIKLEDVNEGFDMLKNETGMKVIIEFD